MDQVDARGMPRPARFLEVGAGGDDVEHAAARGDEQPVGVVAGARVEDVDLTRPRVDRLGVLDARNDAARSAGAAG